VTHAGSGSGNSTPSPERVAELVDSLASVMRQSDVTELDLDLGEVSIRLRRPAQCGEPERRVVPDGHSSVHSPEEEPGHLVTAPMVGTFYASPMPNAAPFVSVGDDVVAGQTIGIIEAMKIMNEIAADRSGIVQEIFIRNGQPVEYGSPLLRLGPARSPRP
jgi:acetyl-CoA carboxylase biotin carboxyl carrier protein